MAYTKSLEELIAKLVKLPGIGRRSAERIAMFLLQSSDADVKNLTSAIIRAKQNIRLCKICNILTEGEVCQICQNPARDNSTICVVEEPKDVIAFEKTAKFQGLYHVLMGSISPLDGRGPEDIKIKELIDRIKNKNIKEIIIATDSDTEGETTAIYLNKLIKPLGVKVTRIGLGVPVGSNLEYIDSTTLSLSLESRREL
ncbi:MAG: recombination mediator RecR [Candidatus Omnitrophica bacterium]|nr:recombination mediator RecR [Candidatus Omnitrophota bacterium]HOX53978.1 recombination mediator RecR [Candidatus Omnitrophota bacterium]